jgi:hypothetical protein
VGEWARFPSFPGMTELTNNKTPETTVAVTSTPPLSAERIARRDAHLLAARTGLSFEMCHRAVTLGSSAIRASRDRELAAWTMGCMGIEDVKP